MPQREQSGPELPLEIILAIVEHAFANVGIEDRFKVYGILSANRTIYGLVSERLYRTSVLHSSRMTNKFIDALGSSTRLASLTKNLWIATLGFEPFSYQLGSSSNSVMRILTLTPNLQHLALPSQYFPRVTESEHLPPINHLTTTEDVFPPSTPNLLALHTIHVHGPLWPTRIETIISHCPNLRHVVCTIPYSSQTYVTPAAQCANTLLVRLPSLASIEFASSKRVALSLKKLLGEHLDDKSKYDRVSINTLTLDEESPCDKWFQECNDTL
ncbi:hypothetical protein BDV93DRAFT_34769 [Ceratobasidium sp. AG-I]|nr:hypothetical protein BDV93DRAFT_34769 [Ceratobasidium sp. AG-I]